MGVPMDGFKWTWVEFYGLPGISLKMTVGPAGTVDIRPTTWIRFQTLEDESETAANCFATAQEIKDQAPILPFNTISLAFE